MKASISLIITSAASWPIAASGAGASASDEPGKPSMPRVSSSFVSACRGICGPSLAIRARLCASSNVEYIELSRP
eukprot:451379-Prymnesium_polylepis.1